MGRKKKDAVVKDANVVELKATNVFTRNMECKEDVIVNRGGAGSGKSHAITQLLVYKFLTENNKKILIVRKSLPSLRISVMWLLHRIFDDFGIMDRVKIDKVGLNYYYGSNVIHLGSVDNPEKMKSTEWNYIWFEEATEFTLQEFELVQSRLRAPKKVDEKNQIYMSFNPIDESHWIKTELLDKRDGIVEIHSTYRDNFFMGQEYRDYLDNTSKYNYNFYRVYALGEWGRLDDLIYSNWDIVTEVPTEGAYVYGLDFGFNVPSALVRLRMHPNFPKTREVWEEELIYREKLTNPQLIQEIKRVLDPKELQKPFYCDAAEPDRIKEMKQAGINAKPANKRVFDGINFVQSLHVNVLVTSTNIIKEKRAYSWKKDKLTNKAVDEPIPNLADHLQDAERYGLYTHFGGGKQFRIRWM